MALGGGELSPKDKKGLKEWIRAKLKALASLLRKLGVKAAEALPSNIGGIISWVLSRAKDVAGTAPMHNIGSLHPSPFALILLSSSLLSFYDCVQPASYQLLLSLGSL